MKKNPLVDAYIQKSAPFAQPILTHLRALVHGACPDVEEAIKWGFPNFMYRGQILCNMASFKQHCSFGFWNAKNMQDPHGLLETVGKTAMGHLGKITSMDELPSDEILAEYIQRAMQAEKTTAPPKKTAAKRTFEIPVDLQDALAQNEEAKAVFEAFSPSHKWEYVEWIGEAKKEETRKRRVEQTVRQLLEKKSLHHKYGRKNG